MPLAIVAVIMLIMKLLDIDPVAHWNWLWVLAPFALLFLWWEWLAEVVGWNKKMAAKKMADDDRIAEETKRKNRGF